MHDCQPSTACHDCGPPGGPRRLAWAEISALLVLAAFLGYAWMTGRVQAALAPGYAWLPPSAAGLLAGMALARLLSLRHGSGCDCQPSSSRVVRWGLTAALVAPVAMGLAIDPRQFSAEGVRRRAAPAVHDGQLQRAIAWVLAPAGRTTAVAAPDAQLPAEPTVLDLARAADVGQAAAWTGRFVSVIGQCDLGSEADGRRFGLYRFVVTCCIADAQLVAVEVAAPPDVRLEPRQWVRVEGVIRLESDEAGGQPVIHAAAISKIPPPQAPYL